MARKELAMAALAGASVFNASAQPSNFVLHGEKSGDLKIISARANGTDVTSLGQLYFAANLNNFSNTFLEFGLPRQIINEKPVGISQQPTEGRLTWIIDETNSPNAKFFRGRIFTNPSPPRVQINFPMQGYRFGPNEPVVVSGSVQASSADKQVSYIEANIDSINGMHRLGFPIVGDNLTNFSFVIPEGTIPGGVKNLEVLAAEQSTTNELGSEELFFGKSKSVPVDLDSRIWLGAEWRDPYVPVTPDEPAQNILTINEGNLYYTLYANLPVTQRWDNAYAKMLPLYSWNTKIVNDETGDVLWQEGQDNDYSCYPEYTPGEDWIAWELPYKIGIRERQLVFRDPSGNPATPPCRIRIESEIHTLDKPAHSKEAGSSKSALPRLVASGPIITMTNLLGTEKWPNFRMSSETNIFGGFQDIGGTFAQESYRELSDHFLEVHDSYGIRNFPSPKNSQMIETRAQVTNILNKIGTEIGGDLIRISLLGHGAPDRVSLFRASEVIPYFGNLIPFGGRTNAFPLNVTQAYGCKTAASKQTILSAFSGLPDMDYEFGQPGHVLMLSTRVKPRIAKGFKSYEDRNVRNMGANPGFKEGMEGVYTAWGEKDLAGNPKRGWLDAVTYASDRAVMGGDSIVRDIRAIGTQDYFINENK